MHEYATKFMTYKYVCLSVEAAFRPPRFLWQNASKTRCGAARSPLHAVTVSLTVATVAAASSPPVGCCWLRLGLGLGLELGLGFRARVRLEYADVQDRN